MSVATAPQPVKNGSIELEIGGVVYHSVDIDKEATRGDEVLWLTALDGDEVLEVSRADIGNYVTVAQWAHLLEVAKPV